MIEKTIPKNTISIFSPQIETLVPFAQFVDPSRENMSSKQLTQVVVSNKTDTPLVIDKFYSEYSEVPSPYIDFAEDDGFVLMKIKEALVLYYKNEKRIVIKHVPEFKKLINNSLELKYCIGYKNSERTVKSFKKGDLLYDYTNVIPGLNIPRTGYRTNILFAKFFGFNADDAIVVSESYAERTEIQYNEKLFIPVTKFLRFLKNKNTQETDISLFLPKPGEKIKEKLLKYNLIDSNDFFLTEIINLDDNSESKYYTKSFKSIENGIVQDIKVHKLSDNTFEELKEKYLYTKDFISELEYYYNLQLKYKEEMIKIFTDLKIPKETVDELSNNIFNQYLSTSSFSKTILEGFRDKYNFDPADIDFVLEIDVAVTVGTTRGDKFTNLYAGKGTVSLILPDEIMPKDPKTGKPFDVIFNPLGIFGRNNWGSIFELGMSKIILDIEQHIDSKQETINRLNFINEYYIQKIDAEYYDTVKELVALIENEPDEQTWIEFQNSVKQNGFYLFSQNFINVSYTDVLENFWKPYEKEFNINILKKETIKYSSELISYMRALVGFESSIFNSKDIESLYESEIEAYFGQNYFLKLYHTSNSKFNAVSYTNSYSKTTGQPIRGRKNHGGQHISWQSTASLLGHKENNNIIKELFTFKSDSVEDKNAFLMKIIKDGKYYMKPKYNSNTKKTINSALKIIGMEFDQE